MLKQKFDPGLPLRVVLYLRMSSDLQNPRSPQQQKDTILDTIRRAGYSWQVVAEYTDSGISGRFVTKRPQFQEMIKRIRTGELAANAILTDTFERFGRSNATAHLRTELAEQYSVLLLTADTGFTDPTSTAGQALSAVEAIRATEDNRIKAHNVCRGKRDAARRKAWPGGAPPFGYMLKSIMVDRNGRSEVDHTVLVPDPRTAWVVQRIFALAHDRGWGSSRIAKSLNDDPTVPADRKPFSSQTVNYWLSRPIYKGELLWEEHSTGVLGDRRVIERNTVEDQLRVPDFCEPLVDSVKWLKVQEVRAARSARTAAARAAGHDPTRQRVRGLALKHPLSGLVVCGVCGLAMTPSSGRPYALKGTAEARRYVYYVCPRYVDGACENARRVPAAWLNETVFGLVRQRLFPTADGSELWEPGRLAAEPWFRDLLGRVQAALDRRLAGRADRRPAIQAEQEALREQVRGWSLSLANPNLSPSTRALLEQEVAGTADRARTLEAELATAAAAADQFQRTADPAAVAERLNRLAEVLAASNPTRTNIELAGHIESIRAFPTGRVVVRTCVLGALAGGADLIGCEIDCEGPSPSLTSQCTPRKRGTRRLDTADAGPVLRALADRATDVDRFAGLGVEWFRDDEFHVPAPTCWAKENAAAIARVRGTGKTHAQLAREFNISVPTVRKALTLAAAADSSVNALPKKLPRSRWQDTHVDAVRALRNQGRSVREIANAFGVSEPLVRAAIALATVQSVEPPTSGELDVNGSASSVV